MARNLYIIEQEIAGFRQQVGGSHTDKSAAHAQMRTWVDGLKKANPDKSVHTRGTFVKWHIKNSRDNIGCVTVFIKGIPLMSWHLIKETF